jgi:hypothetical protein
VHAATEVEPSTPPEVEGVAGAGDDEQPAHATAQPTAAAMPLKLPRSRIPTGSSYGQSRDGGSPSARSAWTVHATFTRMGRATTLAFTLSLLALAVLAGGCRATQAAAARDPMTCERDPSCGKYRGTYSDCSRQCVDNPECMDRCRSAQSDPGLGH